MNKRRILYIEDDQAIATVFNELLTDEGYEVSICDNGEDGLRATLDFKPDMIITGILMPKVSGYDVIYILKNTPETKHIPIVVLSALSRQEDKDRARELGAIEYMVASEVRVGEVVERINKHFESINSGDQVYMSSVCKNCGHDELACTFDEVVRRARNLIIARGVASQALLTRELKISYSFAMRALEQLEEEGLIGPADGARPRQVFTD